MIKTVHLASTNLNSNMGTTKIAARKIAPVPNHNPGGGGICWGAIFWGQFSGHPTYVVRGIFSHIYFS